jgi:cardiolipin synthase
VHIILPKYSDHTFVDLGAQSYFHILLKSGVKIYTIDQPFIHSKSIIIDDEWASVGTMNLDRVSLHYNFEANLIGTQKEFVEALKTLFYKDLDIAKEITLEEWNHRPFLQKWSEFVVRFIRPFL